MRPVRVHRDDRVPPLVVGGEPARLGVEIGRLSLRTHEHLIFCVFEILLGHRVTPPHARVDRRVVDHRGQVGARVAWGPPCQYLAVDVVAKRQLGGVEVEDFRPPPDVGQRHGDVSVEPSSACESFVEHGREVGCGKNYDARVRVEAVKLDQQLVERQAHALLLLGLSRPSDRVDLVDEDEARRLVFGGGEEVADPTRPYAHIHLLKLGTRGSEEWNAGLASYGFGQESLPCARRPHQQHPPGKLAAEAGEFFGVFEEFYNFLELHLGLLAAHDVFERNRAHVARRNFVLVSIPPDGRQPVGRDVGSSDGDRRCDDQEAQSVEEAVEEPLSKGLLFQLDNDRSLFSAVHSAAERRGAHAHWAPMGLVVVVAGLRLG
mmetsp:Transcript_12041/g.21970  ORF Transcript_12041/g.21970 Transcript_12041/m.21970 type:complete len:376 (+) Transcript_12041:820-1947(+)